MKKVDEELDQLKYQVGYGSVKENLPGKVGLRELKSSMQMLKAA